MLPRQHLTSISHENLHACRGVPVRREFKARATLSIPPQRRSHSIGDVGGDFRPHIVGDSSIDHSPSVDAWV